MTGQFLAVWSRSFAQAMRPGLTWPESAGGRELRGQHRLELVIRQWRLVERRKELVHARQ